MIYFWVYKNRERNVRNYSNGNNRTEQGSNRDD